MQRVHNIAIVYENNKLTYKDLNQRSNQLAHYLRNTYNIQGDDLIALCLDRSEYLLIVILGVLKSGAAYVPVDPNYPDERIEYILEDTQAKVILTNDIYVAKLTELLLLSQLPVQDNEVLALTSNQQSPLPSTKDRTAIHAVDNAEFQAMLVKETKNNLEAMITSTNLAYVIYTSGTTGKPKGVMIEHRSYVNTIEYFKNEYFTYQQIISTYSLTNYVFDIFGMEYGLPLLSGGFTELGNINFTQLNCQLYDFIQMTPSLLEIKYKEMYGLSQTQLFIGGEALNINLIKNIRSLSDDNTQHINKIINVYGPTEATIWSTTKKLDDSELISIGRSISNTKIYILDTNLHVLPLGAIGELYIGGAGLAKGYLNNHELTTERFITNPFQTDKEKQQGKNARLYKTGDLVRYSQDGNLEYIGRNDFQVKIRGFRIELGEIESAILNNNSDIKQVVVLMREHLDNTDNSTLNKYLVAYYIADSKLDEVNILNSLIPHLPDYMIPNICVWLEQLPLTINGKLDRKALPDPEFSNNITHIAPQNEIEIRIGTIFAQTIGLELNVIGINDDFFRLGGNSILAIKLTNKLNKLYESHLKVAEIFALKSVAKIAKNIIQEKSKTSFKINNIQNKPVMFMAHPVQDDCKTYTNLANKNDQL